MSQTYEEALAQLKVKHDELVDYQIQLDQRASSAEAFSQHIINDLPIGLIAFDIDGYIQIINSPAEQTFNFLCGTALNQSLEAMFIRMPLVIENIQRILIGNSSFQKFEINLKLGTEARLLEISVAPLIIKNKISGAICLVSNVTEITELREQALTQRNLESLGIMAAGIAHEFKNSLATFNGYAQFLNRQAIDDRTRQASTALIQEVRKFSEMITAFLNFARPKVLIKSAVNLEEIIAECIAELSLLLSQTSLSINIKGQPPIVRADAQMLRQALLNLFRNAVEATLEARSNHPIEVECSQFKDEHDCSWIIIEIRDRGAGFEKNDLPFVFVPFFTTKKHGHGIGLALAHRIIASHAGTLTAANNAEGGAILTVKLKL